MLEGFNVESILTVTINFVKAQIMWKSERDKNVFFVNSLNCESENSLIHNYITCKLTMNQTAYILWIKFYSPSF
jgi:hypothetical protein